MAAVLRTSHTAFLAKAGARVGARDARRVVPRRALVTPLPRTCRRAATVAGAMWTVEHQVEDEDLHAQEVAVRAEHLKGDAFSISLVSPGWNMGDAALNHP